MEYAIGIVISTLSILVTVLIGWQIYNYITLTKTMDSKINKRINEFTKQYRFDQSILTEANNSRHHSTLLSILHAIKMLNLGFDTARIQCYCLSLLIEIVIEMHDEDGFKSIYDNLKSLIREPNSLSKCTKEEIDDLRSNLQKLSVVSPIGFDCLTILDHALSNDA